MNRIGVPFSIIAERKSRTIPFSRLSVFQTIYLLLCDNDVQHVITTEAVCIIVLTYTAFAYTGIGS